MWRGFLWLTLTLALARAAPDFKDLGTSSSSRAVELCEMNPNTCQCFKYRGFSGCNYNLQDCTCFWVYIARDADAKPAPPQSPARNVTSSARQLTTTCHVDFSTCLCGREPVTVPQTDVEEQLAACFTHSSTCECGWDRGIGSSALFVPGKPIIYSHETCVTDYSKCTCLVGTAVTPERPAPTLADKLSDMAASMLVLHGLLLSMIPSTQRMVLEPLAALKTLSIEQRTKLIAESVVVMEQLKGMVEDAEALGRLEPEESGALVAQIRGDVEYLTALSRDPSLLAAQIGEIEQPIVMRLRKVVAAFEEAMRNVKRDGDIATHVGSV